MAAGLSTGPARPATTVRGVLLVLSVGLLLVVGLSGPNAAQPDLAPRGWAPGALLPFALGPAAVTAVLWVAYLAGGAAVLLGIRRRTEALRSWAVPAALGVLTLLAAPFGSADHISYVAYGRILVTGGDPWVQRPVDWGGGLDPVTSRVEAPWTEEPSVYGPFGALLHGLSALLGGDSLRQGVWVWQVLVVLAWLAVRALLRRILDEDAHGRVDVLWTLNPLVLGLGVLGAHIDVVAAALVVAAVAAAAAARWRSPTTGALAAGALVALAGSTKITYAVVAVGLVAGWWFTGTRGRALAQRTGALAVGLLVVGAALHAWAGPHVYDQLLRSRQAVSLAMPWRPLLEWGRDAVGNGPTRLVISITAAILAVALAACLVRLTRPTGWDRIALSDDLVPGATVPVVALWLTGCLALAYSLAAPYSLPWYDLLAWCALPAVRAGPVDVLALLRLLALALAYVPGRVLGMTAGVEEVTLGVRRGVVPWVGLALWVLVSVAGVRSGSWPRSGPPRPGS